MTGKSVAPTYSLGFGTKVATTKSQNVPRTHKAIRKLWSGVTAVSVAPCI